MNYQIRETSGQNYLEVVSANPPLYTENDALDLISLCWEHNINSLMIHSRALADEFFDLSTKSAGYMIQKFVNYNVKAAVILPPDLIHSARFREMVLEANKGNQFRLYENEEDAQLWLLT